MAARPCVGPRLRRLGRSFWPPPAARFVVLLTALPGAAGVALAAGEPAGHRGQRRAKATGLCLLQGGASAKIRVDADGGWSEPAVAKTELAEASEADSLAPPGAPAVAPLAADANSWDSRPKLGVTRINVEPDGAEDSAVLTGDALGDVGGSNADLDIGDAADLGNVATTRAAALPLESKDQVSDEFDADDDLDGLLDRLRKVSSAKAPLNYAAGHAISSMQRSVSDALSARTVDATSAEALVATEAQRGWQAAVEAEKTWSRVQETNEKAAAAAARKVEQAREAQASLLKIIYGQPADGGNPGAAGPSGATPPPGSAEFGAPQGQAPPAAPQAPLPPEAQQPPAPGQPAQPQTPPAGPSAAAGPAGAAQAAVTPVPWYVVPEDGKCGDKGQLPCTMFLKVMTFGFSTVAWRGFVDWLGILLMFSGWTMRRCGYGIMAWMVGFIGLLVLIIGLLHTGGSHTGGS